MFFEQGVDLKNFVLVLVRKKVEFILFSLQPTFSLFLVCIACYLVIVNRLVSE